MISTHGSGLCKSSILQSYIVKRHSLDVRRNLPPPYSITCTESDLTQEAPKAWGSRLPDNEGPAYTYLPTQEAPRAWFILEVTQHRRHQGPGFILEVIQHRRHQVPGFILEATQHRRHQGPGFILEVTQHRRHQVPGFILEATQHRRHQGPGVQGYLIMRDQHTHTCQHRRHQGLGSYWK